MVPYTDTTTANSIYNVGQIHNVDELEPHKWEVERLEGYQYCDLRFSIHRFHVRIFKAAQNGSCTAS